MIKLHYITQPYAFVILQKWCSYFHVLGLYIYIRELAISSLMICLCHKNKCIKKAADLLHLRLKIAPLFPGALQHGFSVISQSLYLHREQVCCGIAEREGEKESYKVHSRSTNQKLSITHNPLALKKIIFMVGKNEAYFRSLYLA